MSRSPLRGWSTLRWFPSSRGWWAGEHVDVHVPHGSVILREVERISRSAREIIYLLIETMDLPGGKSACLEREQGSAPAFCLPQGRAGASSREQVEQDAAASLAQSGLWCRPSVLFSCTQGRSCGQRALEALKVPHSEELAAQ